MQNLPQNTVIHFEQDGEYERVIMAHATNTTGRVGAVFMVATITGVAGYFWFDALMSFLDGTWRFDDAGAFVFTTFVLGFGFFLAKMVLRSRIPESVVVAGGGLILDSGVDPFRASHLEKGDQRRQSEQLVKPRRRVHLSANEMTGLAMTDFPYQNRLYVETNGARYDIGEALTAEERVWLHEYLAEKLGRKSTLVSSGLNALIETVEEEEKHEPLITDVHSPHRVDPLDFDDEIARQAEWHSLAETSANFRTHELLQGQRMARFKSTVGARAFALTFVMVGVLALILAFRELQANDMAVNFESVFVALFSVIFGGSGIYLVRLNYTPIVFDQRKRTFRRGWRPYIQASFENVRGIQLLSFVPVQQGIHTGYEMNLLMADSSRIHVICHGDGIRLRHDAKRLADLIGVRVYDGIRGHAAATPENMFSRGSEENSLKQRLAVVPAVVFGLIILWVIVSPTENNEPAQEMETKQQQGHAVEFDELLSHARTIDDPLRRHFSYQSLLNAPGYSHPTADRRLLLLFEATEFYLQYEGMDGRALKALLTEADEIISQNPELDSNRQRLNEVHRTIFEGTDRRALTKPRDESM